MFLKISDRTYIAFSRIESICIYKDYSNFYIKISVIGQQNDTIFKELPTIEQAEKELSNIIEYIEEQNKKNNQITVNTYTN